MNLSTPEVDAGQSKGFAHCSLLAPPDPASSNFDPRSDRRRAGDREKKFRVDMAAILLRSITLSVLAGFIPACKPPSPAPPPTSGTVTSSTGNTYTVSVGPVGPQTWSYLIVAKFPFVSVTIHSKDDISHCVLTSNGASPSQGATASKPADTDQKLTALGIPPVTNPPTAAVPPGWIGITLHLKCDMTNGPVDLLFEEPAGEKAVVGPLAGPSK
jgi:hypothetical protein